MLWSVTEAGDKLAEGIGRYRQATEAAAATAAELAASRQPEPESVPDKPEAEAGSESPSVPS